MDPTATGDSLAIHLEAAQFPADRLRVHKVTGREAVGQLFSFELLVACDDHAGVDLDAVAGAEATLVFERNGAEVRRVHGVIVQADDHFRDTKDHRVYRLCLAPRAQRLAMIRTSEVFVDISVPDVIRQKLELVGLDPGGLRLRGEYPPRDLIIQYEETDLAFVSRLAEHLGVSLCFETRDGRDAVVFTDHADGFSPVPGAGKVLFRARGEARDVFELRAERRVVPAYYAVRDYDYNHPQLDLTATHELATGHPGGVIEQGSNHRTHAQGRALAAVRAEEQESLRLVYTGMSDRCELTAGGRFSVEDHPDLDTLALLVVAVEHEAVPADADERPYYRNRFRAVPAAATYRPPRTTPRPRIPGLVTGIIDGAPNGNQAYAPIDEHGRYRVHFLFDTSADSSRPVSCPVRMLQNHTGENYGTHFPLRAGAEVLVGFVNGDPDRPAIVGAVPNPLKPSPVTLSQPVAHRVRTASGITFEICDEP